MAALKVVLTVIFLIISVIMVVIVLMQEGKSSGLAGSISGGAETFWGKNKSRTAEGKLEKYTKIGAAVFMILALALNMF